MKVTRILFVLLSLTIMLGCSKETVEPELFGVIEGTVTNSETGIGIGNASIITTPATEAILTNDKGIFKLKNVPTGNYIIKASRSGFGSTSVNVMVREDGISTASIVIEAKDEGAAAKFLQAAVTSWFQSESNDSSFVEVEYKVTNSSSSTDINEFELYFDIFTNGDNFLYEVADTTLKAGENNFGSFKKFVRSTLVDSVNVSGIWTPN